MAEAGLCLNIPKGFDLGGNTFQPPPDIGWQVVHIHTTLIRIAYYRNGTVVSTDDDKPPLLSALNT